MKKVIVVLGLFFCLIGLCSYSFAQEGKKGGTELEGILQNAEEINYKNRDKIYNIFNLDVFTYFELSKYNTELKKGTFLKTTEYGEKLNELKKLKQEMLQQYFFVEGKIQIKDYDVKRKGFELIIGLNSCPPKTVEYIYLPFLPVEKRKGRVFSDVDVPDTFREFLFFAMSEKQGLIIEDNKEDIKQFFIFKIEGIKNISCRELNLIYLNWDDVKRKILFANSVRWIVANKKTGDIYFDPSSSG